jgi:cyd operon protein YbgT
MWYFVWIIGLGLATLFAIMSAMWHECDLGRPRE